MFSLAQHTIKFVLPCGRVTKRIERRTMKTCWIHFVKVAEHSFSARFCWCNVARAQGFQKTNMPPTERSFYLLKPALSVLFFSIIACSVLMALVFYYNDMLQKVTMQRTQQFSAVCYPKNPFSTPELLSFITWLTATRALGNSTHE